MIYLVDDIDDIKDCGNKFDEVIYIGCEEVEGIFLDVDYLEDFRGEVVEGVGFGELDEVVSIE